MPWKIVRRLGKHCVVKERPDGSAGETVHCHATYAQAVAQLRALYASEKKQVRYVEFELATVVPVLGRPQNVVPLVRSFLESGQPGLLLFVVEVDDVEEMLEVERACENFRVRMLRVVDAHSWPEKINAGVEAVRADWYLCAADDVRFVPGWWDQTRELRNSDVGVIGTNDALPGTPGNPAVANGSHTCHPLISREYIDRYGTIDEPGVAVHDGYRHWCVDNELCVTAMVRGKWAFCREAVILHNHPYWGRGVWDDTYRRGEENNEADLALWEERRTTLLGLPQLMNTEDIIRCYFAEKIREATGKTISWRELNIEYDSQNDYCWSEYTHDPAYAKITVWRGSEVIAELDGLEDFGGLIQELVAFAAKVDN